MPIKILLLASSRLGSLDRLSEDLKSGLPWIDAMIAELGKSDTISLAFALQSGHSSLEKRIVKGITLYAMPDFRSKNVIRRTLEHITGRNVSAKVNREALKAIEDFNPDIIQVFGSENPFGLIANLQHRPVILYIQGFLSIVIEKWYSGISRWNQFRFANFKGLLLRYSIFSEYYTDSKRAEREREILKNCKYFFGRTDFDKRIVSLLSPGSKYFHCEEFIREDFFKARWDRSLGMVVRCVSILKGTSYKGVDLLVETMLLLQKYSSCCFEFNISGIAEDEELIRIIRLKYGRGSLQGINFLGRKVTKDLIALMCDSDFYLHPSYVENSPNSVCEAMILGMPIISTNVGGVSSLITDKKEGILVQEGDPYSLAGAILELVKDYEFARVLGQNARKRSIERHDPKAIAHRLVEVYEIILNKNG
ncbi:MAG: glycosyltransferase family 4 protein [Bacteroidales bacterium]|nr:glycosyltransferase family 4 protein [Bacteroidales bacterium]